MDKQIVFTKVNTAELLDVESRPLGENEVRVKTVSSTISNGTEKANITGDPLVATDIKPGKEAVFPRTLGIALPA